MLIKVHRRVVQALNRERAADLCDSVVVGNVTVFVVYAGLVLDPKLPVRVPNVKIE